MGMALANVQEDRPSFFVDLRNRSRATDKQKAPAEAGAS
jgi:hypothetical protein